VAGIPVQPGNWIIGAAVSESSALVMRRISRIGNLAEAGLTHPISASFSEFRVDAMG